MELYKPLRSIILSKEEVDSSDLAGYELARDIVGNTICADLIDYLSRDHRFSGLPAMLGRRFIDGFYVTPSSEPHYARRMAIKLKRGARLRADVVSELFKYLRYRYELSERVLVHHAKLAADAMVGKALEMWRDSMDETAPALPTSEGKAEGAHPVVIGAVSASLTGLEGQALRRGDDGLLEYLRDIGAGSPDSRLAAVRTIAGDLLDRQLYKPIARSDDASRALATEVYGKFGGASERRQLEVEAASYAGLIEGWHVLLWIPSPDMRLKAAGVLVHDGRSVLPLHEFDKATLKRGTEIYDSHQALWAVSIYVHPSVSERKREVIRRRLSGKLGVTWAVDVEAIQPSPLIQLAAREVAGDLGLTTTELDDLTVDIAAAGGEETFDSLLARAAAVAKERASRRRKR